MKKKISISLLSLFGLMVLTSCDTQAISDKVNNALPNLYITLAQLGAVAVMVFIFIKFGYKPIKKRLNARKEHIDTNVKESDDMVSKAKMAQEDADDNIKKSRVKANQIIEDAKTEAINQRKAMIDDAEEVIDRKKEQAEKDIEERKTLLEHENHNIIVNSALDASKEILGREVNQEDNEKIVDDFIAKMNKDTNSK
ncbi:MAG: ATP synthase F0 subunit B [Bacilli bacterium]